MHRAPTTNMVLARLALQASLGKSVVDWATDQLVQGKDTPHLRRLAGFTGQENAFELEEIFHQTLRELGVSVLDPSKAILQCARELAFEFLEGAVGREFLLRELCQLCIDAGYPGILYPFSNLRWALDDIKVQGWSFYWSDAKAENFDEILKTAVAKFLASTEPSSRLPA